VLVVVFAVHSGLLSRTGGEHGALRIRRTGSERCCGQVRLLHALLPIDLHGVFEQALFQAELQYALMQSCASFKLAHPDTFSNLQRQCLAQGLLTRSELAKILPPAVIDPIMSILTTGKGTRKAAAARLVLGRLEPAGVIEALNGGGTVVLTSKGGQSWKLADLLDRPRVRAILPGLGISADATTLERVDWAAALPPLSELLAAYMQHAGAGALPACARARTHCCGPAE
jgi:hypothetical protein